ncbi:MAG: aspartyl-phosphate phosphatase Spo0E family protein [Thermoanaerobacteraceae bacterium]|nr:aspartyl-phosphate phosphatase Spo0E family protein [Thermoanaerobacteraceae bacterium]
MAIELLRAELDQLVERSPNLTDEEIVKKSQELDRLLTEYYQLIKKKQKEQG